MNPLAVIPILIYTLVVTLWPAQVDGSRRARNLLLLEVVFVVAALVAGHYLALLVEPRGAGWAWGRAGAILTAYLYACGRGVTLVRAVLELPDLRMRRDEDRTTGAVDVARGRAIGILERGLALTLVLLGQFGALGLIVAAKSLARFKALEDRDFAEYFLIGTLASLLLALLVGVGLKLLL
ncbi:MAG TPA: hypothetical protein VF178_01280 [Gemmatimonadaceae bacterium]